MKEVRLRESSPFRCAMIDASDPALTIVESAESASMWSEAGSFVTCRQKASISSWFKERSVSRSNFLNMWHAFFTSSRLRCESAPHLFRAVATSVRARAS
eukprot:scaffold6068_cov119-Isochrysis_galbana.AAC.30